MSFESFLCAVCALFICHLLKFACRKILPFFDLFLLFFRRRWHFIMALNNSAFNNSLSEKLYHDFILEQVFYRNHDSFLTWCLCQSKAFFEYISVTFKLVTLFTVHRKLFISHLYEFAKEKRENNARDSNDTIINEWCALSVVCRMHCAIIKLFQFRWTGIAMNDMSVINNKYNIMNRTFNMTNDKLLCVIQFNLYPNDIMSCNVHDAIFQNKFEIDFCSHFCMRKNKSFLFKSFLFSRLYILDFSLLLLINSILDRMENLQIFGMKISFDKFKLNLYCRCTGLWIYR